MVKALLWWLSALVMSYFMLFLGMHKLTTKVWTLELSDEFYKRCEEFNLRAVEHLSRQLAEQLEKARAASSDGTGAAPIKLPDIAPKTVKQVVGGLQVVLAILWFTKRWRFAAVGSSVVMLLWLFIARQEYFWPPDDIQLAAVLLLLSLSSFFWGPSRPSRRSKSKQR